MAAALSATMGLMRLYHRGDRGAPVTDIQKRLHALTFSIGADIPGHFDTGTEQAVQAFQTSRSLPSDGIVGPQTWKALIAAGYTLGDRLLYYRVPMMVGDDVAHLQASLNSLGFDPRKVDGSFGPDTLDALLDFQVNRMMPQDGIAGRKVAAELKLMSRATKKQGREVVRERQWLRELPHHVAGQRVYIDSFCRSAEESEQSWRASLVFTNILQDLGAHVSNSRSADAQPPEHVRALRANRFGADLVVAFAHPTAGKGPAVLYFASAYSSSHAGERMAKSLADALGTDVVGQAIPILKNTRSPAVVVAQSPMTEETGGKAAQGLINLFADPGE